MSSLKMERTISFGIIVTLAVQTAGALMWGGAAEARLSYIENSLSSRPPVSERLARMEEQMEMARQSLSRIEMRLDQKDMR